MDEMPRQKLKVTHTQGVVAKVKWIPFQSPSYDYTGFYQEETENVLLRLSQTVNLTPSSTGLLPSLALKFLINGQKSENLFGMPSFAPIDSWDFLAEDMSSRVDPFTDEIEIATI